MSKDTNKKNLHLEKDLNWKDTLRIQGVMAKGYGITPKMVMLDRRLSIEAKAIYSYFCSYAGAGSTAFPSRDKILKDLGIGKDRYYKHFNLLKETGYIEVDQVRKGDGIFKSNIYTLITNPEETQPKQITVEKKKLPSTQNKDTVKKVFSPSPQIQYTDNRDSENKDTIINKSSNIINSVIYNQSINQENDTIEEYKKVIQSNLEYSILIQQYEWDKKEIDELINIMIEVLDNPKGHVTINGQKISNQKIGDVFLQLKGDHIEYVLISTRENPTQISNLKNYLIATLYNSFFTMNHYWKNKANYDMSKPDFYKKIKS